VQTSSREERQERILDAALALVIEGGVDAMTMGRLASASGLSRPAIYQYFASREEILGELLLNDMADLSNSIDESLRGAGDARNQIEAWVASTFNHLCDMQHRALKEVSVASLPESQRGVIKAMHGQFITTLIAPLAQLKTPDLMPTAYMIFGAVNAASDRAAAGAESALELAALQRFVSAALPD
jgi:AcrR family transcriptional regulator